MNVYDFDKTILRGDSTKLFYAWSLKRHPRIALRWPGLMVHFLRWKMGRIDKTGFKTKMFLFLKDIGDVEKEVLLFWKENESRLFQWYLMQKQPDDVIISASPEFLLQPVCRKLNVKMIGSRVDPSSGAYDGINCYGAEKVIRFQEQYPHAQIEAFYSDSRTDAPMAGLAKKAFFIRDGVPEPW